MYSKKWEKRSQKKNYVNNETLHEPFENQDHFEVKFFTFKVVERSL